MCDKKGAIIKQRFEFAMVVVNLYKYLANEKREFILSK